MSDHKLEAHIPKAGLAVTEDGITKCYIQTEKDGKVEIAGTVEVIGGTITENILEAAENIVDWLNNEENTKGLFPPMLGDKEGS